jgi:uncharacterized protein (TIGR02145 family)
MKKRILFLGILLIVFGFRIDAQTLKNIHRHNQPVLRIPTHLIDKVETAEVNGAQVLQVRQLNGYVSEIPLSQIDSITHSEGEAVDPAQLGNLRTASVMGVVTGPTGAPEMNAIVLSPYGGEETRTDPNGVFFLNNILVYDKLGYITITKPGFHQASRSFLPLETGSNRVNVQLLPMTQSGTFSSTMGGTVTSGLLQLTFPANAIIRSNGQPYTGTVRVYAAALDPTSNSMFDQMPGELLGGLNDSLRLLRSFGMASVELRDANMNELQLATGVSATLTFNIPASLQAEAPATIDWWSFDETLGFWKHEGEAQKQGTQYIGQASHFSWWNVDEPARFNELLGTVYDVNGEVISNAKVNVISTSLGTGTTYTNAEGQFSGRVPKNVQLELNVFLICSSTNDWALAHTEFINSATQMLSVEIIATLTEQFPITGTLFGCQGQPVTNGYVKLGSQIYLTNQGNFTIQTCAQGQYQLLGFDNTIPDSLKSSEMINVQVDSAGVDGVNLTACAVFYSSLTDIDGNIYLTVLIGNQWWMAENLRTSSYANGDSILNVVNGATWIQLDSGAWSNHNNLAANDSIYGKLYNWFTTSDPRNLCPIGWHVPTDTEWTDLTDYLGGLTLAGGKMKSIVGWNAPNTNANNESGFSALSSGSRDAFNSGSFFTNGCDGNWWSSSESLTTAAWYYYLSCTSGSAFRASSSMRYGYSVRCIKD